MLEDWKPTKRELISYFTRETANILLKQLPWSNRSLHKDSQS